MMFGNPLDDRDWDNVPDQSLCEGCGLPTYGEGRYTDDEIYLCGPCFEAVPVQIDEAAREESGS